MKGIRSSPQASKACAMCRAPFSIDQLEQSLEIEKKSLETQQQSSEVQWLYEGKSGFWIYDENSTSELENAYNQKKNDIVITIAGFAYCVDFQKMIQFPAFHPERIRKIKRTEQFKLDENEFKIKGIAGLRVKERASMSNDQQTTSQNANSSHCYNEIIDVDSSESESDDLSQALSESLQL